jgi:hypothetical protein
MWLGEFDLAWRKQTDPSWYINGHGHQLEFADYQILLELEYFRYFYFWMEYDNHQMSRGFMF